MSAAFLSRGMTSLDARHGRGGRGSTKEGERERGRQFACSNERRNDHSLDEQAGERAGERAGRRAGWISISARWSVQKFNSYCSPYQSNATCFSILFVNTVRTTIRGSLSTARTTCELCLFGTLTLIFTLSLSLPQR